MLEFPSPLREQVGIAQEIFIERREQDAKWGTQGHEDSDWCMILGEEVGEVNKAALEFKLQNIGSWERVREELIQVMAVAMSWVECGDKRNGETT